MSKKYKIAGSMIIVLGIISVINAVMHYDWSDICLGVGFVIIGLIYFMKKDK
ncbi:MAG: hypothetical protein PUB98_06240 [Clostridiales bacterium]|nr:hypothetical protein [Clostridiales bacterium]